MTAPFIQRLLDPSAYAEAPTHLEMRQTHISWLIFTDRFVYKIKKPVDLGFLDFRTLESRRHFCEQELRLNRRLAASVYLKVVPIRQDDRGGVRMEGVAGRVIDLSLIHI